MNDLKTLNQWYRSGLINQDAATFGRSAEIPRLLCGTGLEQRRRYNLGAEHGQGSRGVPSGEIPLPPTIRFRAL